ncbi:PI-PLC domain-containing protein [Flavobacterium algicola]|uniref:hypothetical protein n=1 Tax=Flavobacterium algicola TaxID=556529 RepID=UPI001EFE2081|nr:hypothetical protein [Flavobacterium algicola]MCG9790844.1 hypothetical protein [Flavobacterium algicola]
MTYRDNDVYFSLCKGYSLISGSYTIDSFSVTDGQDPDKHIHNGLKVAFGSDGKMSFSIGRKGSEKVAKWFNNSISSSKNTFNHQAGELNFAFLGTLKLTLTGAKLAGRTKSVTFSNISIAQGHSGASNNWWFGGRTCNHCQNNTVKGEGLNSNGELVYFNFLRGDNDVNSIDITSLKFVDTARWMSKLNDATRLDQIMMPGSHDAGMSELHHCLPAKDVVGGLTQTQSGPIKQQLENGSRYFDIRVDYDYDELVTYHRADKFNLIGFGANGQNLVSILDQTRDFLKVYSNETVILKFSHIRSLCGHEPANTKQKIDRLLEKYKDSIYERVDEKINQADVKPDEINLAKAPLGVLRGKMILVFDYKEHIKSSTGRFRYNDGDSALPNLTVYDKYSDTSNYNEMCKDQLIKWKENGGLGKGFLFLLSWTLTTGNPLLTIRGLATEANNNLPNVLHNEIVTKKSSKPNIVYIDYLESATAQSIIMYNFD